MEKIRNFDCKCYGRRKENSLLGTHSCSDKLSPELIEHVNFSVNFELNATNLQIKNLNVNSYRLCEGGCWRQPTTSQTSPRRVCTLSHAHTRTQSLQLHQLKGCQPQGLHNHAACRSRKGHAQSHLMHNNQFYHHNSVTAKIKKIASYLNLE